jgi:hypothetical protein
MRLTSLGLAVGTTNAQEELSLYNSSAGPKIGLRGAINYFILREDDAGNKLVIGNASDLLTITGAGRVGIGTSTPGYALDVAGDINLTGSYKFKINGVDIGGGGGSGTVTAVNVQSPLISDANPTSPTLGLSTTGAVGNYGTSGTNVINTLAVDSWGRITAVTTAVLPPVYTPAPPVLYNVTPGYVGGGRVVIKTTVPTIADVPTGVIQPGDVWLDTSGGTGYTQSLVQNGWTQLPNGLKMAWGLASAVPVSSVLTVTLPTTFTQIFNAQATIHNAAANQSTAYDVWSQVVALGTTSIQLITQTTVTGNNGSTYPTYWYVVGV